MENRTDIPPIAPDSLHQGCKVVAMSDVGRVREENQDFMGYFRRGEQQLLVVADGMGGHSGGFEASRIAVAIMGANFADAAPDEHPREVLSRSVISANAAVRQAAATNPILEGMGTTIVAAIIKDDVAWLCHIGDSRGYLIRDNAALLVTLDHSRLFRMLEAGMIRPDQMEDHPMGHILERSVGSSEAIEVDVRQDGIQLKQGDRLMLCSDGLWGMINDDEIAELFGTGDLKGCVENSIAKALLRGADDNTTVGALEMVEGPDMAPTVEDIRAPLLGQSEPKADSATGEGESREVTQPVHSAHLGGGSLPAQKKKTTIIATVLVAVVLTGLVVLLKLFGGAGDTEVEVDGAVEGVETPQTDGAEGQNQRVRQGDQRRDRNQNNRRGGDLGNDATTGDRLDNTGNSTTPTDLLEDTLDNAGANTGTQIQDSQEAQTGTSVTTPINTNGGQSSQNQQTDIQTDPDADDQTDANANDQTDANAND